MGLFRTLKAKMVGIEAQADRKLSADPDVMEGRLEQARSEVRRNRDAYVSAQGRVNLVKKQVTAAEAEFQKWKGLAATAKAAEKLDDARAAAEQALGVKSKLEGLQKSLAPLEAQVTNLRAAIQEQERMLEAGKQNIALQQTRAANIKAAAEIAEATAGIDNSVFADLSKGSEELERREAELEAMQGIGAASSASLEQRIRASTTSSAADDLLATL